MTAARMKNFIATAVLVGVVAGSGGCHRAASRSPYTADADAPRDPEAARGLVARAKQQWKQDPNEAEKLLREALAADLFNGPAHNNLGVMLMERGELYEASGEFEWARKLMPGHPDPRVNLALTLEKAGKTDDALQAYDSALAVYDNYLPALKGKARLQVMTGRTGKDTIPALEEIALRGDESWRAWAGVWKSKLAARGQ